MEPRNQTERQEKRLRRQIEQLSQIAPPARRPIRSVLDGRLRYVRLPLGILLIMGGLVGFLPVVGFWMIPLGLLLVAVDLPFLRPFVTSAMVRLRRWLRVRLARHKRRDPPKPPE